MPSVSAGERTQVYSGVQEWGEEEKIFAPLYYSQTQKSKRCHDAVNKALHYAFI